MAEMNNRHGHAACGHVLHALAKLLQARVRATALVARWGGEEFLALLPDTPPAGAHEMAEQLRLAVQNTPFCWQQATVPVKVSVGAATWSSGPFHANALIARADSALYQAKNSGRNRVCVAADNALHLALPGGRSVEPIRV
jgi:diguanylate cyclase (GGDEF)-like protein